ncbi:MAG TPA: amino acid permease [Acetobacteraceae bacterium]|nr:amino acid permease [Acetobacteraceae bacterium]
MPLSFTKLLVGRPLGNRESEGRKLGILTGVPAMGLDGLGSAAYGPEAALTILAVTGSSGLGAIRPITLVILLLLAILFFSYWQTIVAYPNNGGSYIVAKENLGTQAGLLAAAALMLDYLLNVSVGISAGVGAMTSAIPALHPYTLPLCLGILAAITVINLRGTRESGVAMAVPAYLFVASLGLTLAWGLYRAIAGGGHPTPVVPPSPIPPGAEAVTAWLVVRAFASGCTAMTGIEAVSNGVSAFREPRVRYAHRTLTAIVVILGLLLLGIAHAAQAYGVTATDQTKPGYQSVVSQIVGAVYGRGWFYYVTIGSVLAVLCLSANTSFVGFPRLCRLVAVDGFLPRPFAVAGRRLVYSVGVLFLAIGAGALLIAFGGITDRLIPLFAVGAFLSFTLSQAGMAAHWRTALIGGRKRIGREAAAIRTKLAINGFGAMSTGAALAVILAAKFLEGAWLTAVIVPGTIVLLRAVRRNYDEIDRQVLRDRHRRIVVRDTTPPVVLVPIKQWDRLARKAVEYALRVSSDVTALHVTELEGPDAKEHAQRLQRDWHAYVEGPATRAGLTPPRLELVYSEFRSMTAPLLRKIQEVQRRSGDRVVTVVLPELVDGRWWGFVMHAHRQRKLRGHLLRHAPNVVVSSVPWQLQPAHPEEAIAEEEPVEAATLVREG